MSDTVRVVIVGDFNPSFQAHLATNEALSHAGDALEIPLELKWLPTPALTPENAERVLAPFDAIWISAGSPYDSMEGAFAAITYARTRGKPLYGT